MKWSLREGVAFGALRVPFRLRIFFRGAFLLLALAVAALALSVLADEKQRSQRAYAEGLARNQAQIAARLRHPTGQLALLNARYADSALTPARPLVLPFAAIDLDDRAKAQQAVETAGCSWQYPSGATLCNALGADPRAGAFVYVVASFASGPPVAYAPGSLETEGVTKIEFTVQTATRQESITALYQLASDGRGRLAGFDGAAPITHGTRPLRDFRGWLWQQPDCIDAAAAPESCARRTFVSARLPLESLREALAVRPVVWPPADLERMSVHVRASTGATNAFDSAAAGAVQAFSFDDLRALLLPGETLTVQRDGEARTLVTLAGSSANETIAPWIAALIRRLPVAGFDAPLEAREAIATPLGRYTLKLRGDLRGVNQALAAVATRLMGYVAAILAAILLTWLALEVTIIRRITLLTRRAAAASSGVRGSGTLADLNLDDLRGGDELGVLAQGLRDLLQRVNEDMRRERIRAEQERDQWHAVGHEIVAPLQSLRALHGAPGDPAERYVARMLAAVRVLYGQASPSEAIQSRALDMATLDLDAFLSHVAANAHYIGIETVTYQAATQPCRVRADEYSLEDVIGHVLRNADRHRRSGTTILITLEASDATHARVTIHNQGMPIDAALLERIFEYGVSGESATEASGQRGQGLFVARTYLAKMGGTIAARNTADGVAFEITLPRAA